MKQIIAIDVGNSETTVGVGCSTKWTGYRFTTRKTITSDELLMMFKTIIDVEPINENIIDGAVICSVVPQITNSVTLGWYHLESESDKHNLILKYAHFLLQNSKQ